VSRTEATGGVQARDRLFEPQLSLTGLRGFALPIARRVALLHAGEVTAASNPGEGTTARLTLPAARVAWPDQHRSARAA
jgi:signal transduction histidine kinase